MEELARAGILNQLIRYLVDGGQPTLNSPITLLNSQISSSYNETLEPTSQVSPKSSDIVQETLLTTQEPHSVGERLQAGIERFEGSTPEGELSKSSTIQLEVSHGGTTPLKTLAEIVLAVAARSPISNDPAIGEASLAHSSAISFQEEKGFEAMVHDSNLVKSPPIQLEVPIIGEQHTVTTTVPTPIIMNDLLVDQLYGLANIAQQFLTTDMSNQDYQAILLSYQIDVEEQQQKIINEAEQDGNLDA
ncbi:hypothetical protein AgCh_000082 [Apium graveolens]